MKVITGLILLLLLCLCPALTVATQNAPISPRATIPPTFNGNKISVLVSLNKTASTWSEKIIAFQIEFHYPIGYVEFKEITIESNAMRMFVVNELENFPAEKPTNTLFPINPDEGMRPVLFCLASITDFKPEEEICSADFFISQETRKIPIDIEINWLMVNEMMSDKDPELFNLISIETEPAMPMYLPSPVESLTTFLTSFWSKIKSE